MREAATHDADLSPADRRHLRAIAEAVIALVEPQAPAEQATEPNGESVQPTPG